MTFDALFKNASVGILISDLEGTILKCNPFALNIFGYEDIELIGRKVEVLIPENLREAHVRNRDLYLEAPNSRSMGAGRELKALRKSGDVLDVEVSLSQYVGSCGPSIAVFINEITQRKKLQEDLEAVSLELEEMVAKRTRELTEALSELSYTYENLAREVEYRKEVENHIRKNLEREKELNDLKSRFVSMASHEFRTPLGGIITSISLIDKYLHLPEPDSNMDSKIKKHICKIKRSVKNLTGVLDTFIDLDKLDHGIIVPSPRHFSVARVVNEIGQELGDSNETNVKVYTKHEDEGLILFQDKNMLRNLLVNLISNAIKYSHEGGVVHVETSKEESNLVISVIDEGIGIPADEQKYLFTRFFRARNVKAINGTGLGLTIVCNYLKLMGGRIEVMSKENQGTTFKVTLPLEMK